MAAFVLLPKCYFCLTSGEHFIYAAANLSHINELQVNTKISLFEQLNDCLQVIFL